MSINYRKIYTAEDLEEALRQQALPKTLKEPERVKKKRKWWEKRKERK